MSPHYYIVKDVDEQSVDEQGNLVAYAGILTVWTPNGSVSFAVDKIQVDDSMVHGYCGDTEVLVFNKQLPWGYYDRVRATKHTEAEMFERELEAAQTKQMREKRVQGVLNPQDNRDGGYR